jgi:hypothetical protein
MRPGGAQNLDDFLAMMIGILIVVLLIVLVVAIFYLLTLQKALSRVSPRNRTMEPGMVWLMLIPCVNLVWQFFIAIRVPESLRNEFRARGRDDGSDYGKSIALTQAILGIVSSVISNGSRAAGSEAAPIGSCISGILSLIGLVLFITFWVKVANYSSQLARHDDYGDDYGRPFGDYDEGGRDAPRRGPPGPSPDTYRPDDRGRYH